MGGSSLGDGVCKSKGNVTHPISEHLGGFIRIVANDLAHAETFLEGNPVYEAGGKVEIRELPED